MKPALNDLALPPSTTPALLPAIRALGFAGLEVAPHRLAGGTAGGLPTAAQAEAFRRSATAAGLELIGLHGLLAGRPDLALFQAPDVARRTVDHLVGLSALCRDMGGRTLILGRSGRQRGALSLKAAWLVCRDLLEAVLPRIEGHGTVLCLAPLGQGNGDFALTANDCRVLADAIDHPALGLQLNSAAQVANNDTGHVPFNAARGRLEQFAVTAPSLAVPGDDDGIDHVDFRRHLATLGYRGWLVLKQGPTARPLDGIGRGMALLTGTYLRADRHGAGLLSRTQPAPWPAAVPS